MIVEIWDGYVVLNSGSQAQSHTKNWIEKIFLTKRRRRGRKAGFGKDVTAIYGDLAVSNSHWRFLNFKSIFF